MQVTLRSTTRVVSIGIQGVDVPGRIWEGTTASGVPVVAVITRLSAPALEDQAEFVRDLEERAAPSEMAIRAIPARLVL